MSWLSCMSNSANTSDIWGGVTGWRDRASGASFLDPLSHCAVKLYAIRCVFNRWSWGFSILSRRWLLRMEISGLWSVMMVKCCSPVKNILHLETAQHTASISSLMTAYLDSVSVRNRDSAWIRFHVPAVFCCNMKPKPWRLASVDRRVGLLISK